MLRDRRMRRILILSVFLMAIVVCSADSFDVDEIDRLEKGMTPDAVDEAIGDRAINWMTMMDFDGTLWTIKWYKIHSGEISNKYTLTFKDGFLFYWGYQHEYQRSKDEEINKLGKRILEEERKRFGNRIK